MRFLNTSDSNECPGALSALPGNKGGTAGSSRPFKGGSFLILCTLAVRPLSFNQ